MIYNSLTRSSQKMCEGTTTKQTNEPVKVNVKSWRRMKAWTCWFTYY